MNFPFQAQKITETASVFLEQHGGVIEVLKLVKLLYLSDRKSIELRGIPIFGGKYCSLRHGPITSEGLDLINGQGRFEDQKIWNQMISSRNGNILTLLDTPTRDHVSTSELKILQSVFEEHGHKTASALRNWCHEHVKEYEETEGCIPITLKEIGLAVDMDTAIIVEEAAAYSFMKNALAS